MALPKPQLNGDVLAYDEIQTDVLNDPQLIFGDGFLVKKWANGILEIDAKYTGTTEINGKLVIPLPGGVTIHNPGVSFLPVITPYYYTGNLTVVTSVTTSNSLSCYLFNASDGSSLANKEQPVSYRYVGLWKAFNANPFNE